MGSVGITSFSFHALLKYLVLPNKFLGHFDIFHFFSRAHENNTSLIPLCLSPLLPKEYHIKEFFILAQRVYFVLPLYLVMSFRKVSRSSYANGNPKRVFAATLG